MNKKNYLNVLINNMFDNLIKSIDCIKDDGKSSVIYYFSALELLFKARLFKEHWAFILQNIDDKKANINNIKNGDFLTVSFDTAISRIQNLFQDLDSGYEKYFENLRKIRNQLIHFDCTNPNDKDFSIKNISETWYYIYALLNDKWKDMFTMHTSQIKAINSKMQSYSEHFWRSKRNALINKNENKYLNNPVYKPIKVDNQTLKCNYCNLSYDNNKNLNMMQMIYDNTTFTLTQKCDICEHEEYIFLFSLFLRNHNCIDCIKSEFNKLIDENLWVKNSTVNKSHYKLLLNTSYENLDIDFDKLIDCNYDDCEIEINTINETTSTINLNVYQDFSIDNNECTAFYVLHITLIFNINMKSDIIEKSSFNELYNAISDVKMEFSIDSDGF